MTRARSAPDGPSWLLPIAVTAIVGASSLALLVRDPHRPGSYGVCPSVLLGFACPGCGGLRGTSELLHGNVAVAWAYNPLVVVAAPLGVALVVRWFLDAARGRPPWAPPSWSGWVVGAAGLTFWVLRNVPALTPYLGPLAVP